MNGLCLCGDGHVCPSCSQPWVRYEKRLVPIRGADPVVVRIYFHDHVVVGADFNAMPVMHTVVLGSMLPKRAPWSVGYSIKQ